jgi:hypothetical protein
MGLGLLAKNFLVVRMPKRVGTRGRVRIFLLVVTDTNTTNIEFGTLLLSLQPRPESTDTRLFSIWSNTTLLIGGIY